MKKDDSTGYGVYASSLFYTGENTLKLVDMKISGDTTDLSGTGMIPSVITGTTGKIELYGCTFENIALEGTASLITVEDGTDTITFGTYGDNNEKNTFSNIQKKSGNGAIISLTMATTTSKLTISNAVFSGCKVTGTGANGGAIYVTITDASA